MAELKTQGGFLEIKTKSPEETLRLGRVLGEMLTGGAVVALIGDLGAGKTLLSKGIAKGLGVGDEREVTSPSFVLVNEYQGRVPIYHIDLYRLSDDAEVVDLGWEEIIYGSGVTLVEWAEKVLTLLPEERIDVQLQWIREGERRLVLVGRGKEYQDLIEQLAQKWEEEE